MMSLVRAIPTEPKLIAGASHRTEKWSAKLIESMQLVRPNCTAPYDLYGAKIKVVRRTPAGPRATPMYWNIVEIVTVLVEY